MGVQECKEHGLLIPYEVLYEKDGTKPALLLDPVLAFPVGFVNLEGTLIC